jgi:ribulose kinase
MSYLIGIDIGTTAAKALVVSDTGEVRASASVEYPLSAPHPNWSEQNPEDWRRATEQSIRAALAQANISPRELKGLGVSARGSIRLSRKRANGLSISLAASNRFRKMWRAMPNATRFIVPFTRRSNRLLIGWV